MNLSPELIEKLKLMADLETYEDRADETCDPNEVFDGDCEEALDQGFLDGKTMLAREILEYLRING